MDEDLWLRAMAGGDREAWAVIYDRYVADVFGFLHHLTGGNRALAEDMNQDVWLIAVQGFDRFDPLKGGFRDWIFGIARHRVARHYRRLAPTLVVDHGADPDGEVGHGLPPLDVLEQIERARVVRAALIRIAPEYRDVLLRKYLHGSSVAEIAVRTGRSAKAVESTLTRARGRLRELLRPYFQTARAKRTPCSDRT